MSMSTSTEKTKRGTESSHIRRKKMDELKFELGQIGMRRGSVDSVSPTDIRHVDEWTMDLTAAEKRRLQKAEATTTKSYSQKPRFYLNETRVEVIIVDALACC